MNGISIIRVPWRPEGMFFHFWGSISSVKTFKMYNCPSLWSYIDFIQEVGFIIPGRYYNK